MQSSVGITELEDQLASAEESIRCLQENLSVMVEQKCALEQRVSLLEQEIAQLKSHGGVMKIVESVCTAENKAIFADTEQLVHNTKCRSLESLLELSSGNLSVDDQNELLRKIVLVNIYTVQEIVATCLAKNW